MNKDPNQNVVNPDLAAGPAIPGAVAPIPPIPPAGGAGGQAVAGEGQAADPPNQPLANPGSPMQVVATKKVKVPAKPAGIWTVAVDFVGAGSWVKIEAAKGEVWSYASDRHVKPCTADGDLLSPFDPAKCLTACCPVGALIGKIGGSSTDKIPTTNPLPSGTPVIFAVGSYCLRPTDSSPQGPLFLTINDYLTGLGDNSGELTVEITILKTT